MLDVLVEKVQNSTSDDIAVLLLGYTDRMKKMLRDQVGDLASTFYSSLNILKLNFMSSHLTLT